MEEIWELTECTNYGTKVVEYTNDYSNLEYEQSLKSQKERKASQIRKLTKQEVKEYLWSGILSMDILDSLEPLKVLLKALTDSKYTLIKQCRNGYYLQDETKTYSVEIWVNAGGYTVYSGITSKHPYYKVVQKYGGSISREICALNPQYLDHDNKYSIRDVFNIIIDDHKE